MSTAMKASARHLGLLSQGQNDRVRVWCRDLLLNGIFGQGRWREYFNTSILATPQSSRGSEAEDGVAAGEDTWQVARDVVMEPQQPRQILFSFDARRVSTVITSIPFPHVDVGGRLINFLPHWQQITTDLMVLEIIGAGYALEFVQNPPPPIFGYSKNKRFKSEPLEHHAKGGQFSLVK